MLTESFGFSLNYLISDVKNASQSDEDMELVFLFSRDINKSYSNCYENKAI